MRSALIALLIGATFAFATVFAPKGVTHHNLIGVTETLSPTSDARDRPLLEFVDPDGNTIVLTFKDTTRAIVAVNAATGATVVTTSTTVTTTTVTTTTVTTTTATTTTVTTTSTTTTT